MTNEEFAGDLRTTYAAGVSDANTRPEDLILGVVRYRYDWLERVVDRNCPALAPPKDLLQQFKTVEEDSESHGDPDPTRIAWENVSVRKRYLGYLERPGPQQCIESLRDRLDDGQNVWLVCLEKDDTFCHRRLLAARIRGTSPTHWSEIYDPPETDTGDPDPQASLDAFGGETA